MLNEVICTQLFLCDNYTLFRSFPYTKSVGKKIENTSYHHMKIKGTHNKFGARCFLFLLLIPFSSLMVMLTLDEDDASKFVGVDRTSGFEVLLTPKQIDARVPFPCCRAVNDEDP